MLDPFPECPHLESSLTKKVHANGVLHYVLQCRACGKYMRSVAKDHDLVVTHDGEIPYFDHAIRERHQAERDAWYDAQRVRIAEQRAVQDAAFWDGYNAYLDSPAWRERRARRLNLDEGRCQARLDVCTEFATQVHHLTYRHLGNEPLFDLISVCESCHEEITRMDRRNHAEREVA